MKKVLALLTILLLVPISVKAENKVYFEKEEVKIKPGVEEKINVKVNADRKFKRVSFDVISTSDAITIESIDAAEGFTKKVKDNVSTFTSEESKESGNIVAIVTIKSKADINQITNGIVRLTNVTLVSDDSHKLASNDVKVTIEPVVKSNYLASLTSEIMPFEFDRNTLTYTLDLENDVDVFDLVAVPESETAKVTISDQTLKKNKTTITIKVEEEEIGVRAYKVIVNKKGSVVETTEKDDNVKVDKNVKNDWIPIIVGMFGVFVIDLLYIKKRK